MEGISNEQYLHNFDYEIFKNYCQFLFLFVSCVFNKYISIFTLKKKIKIDNYSYRSSDYKNSNDFK